MVTSLQAANDQMFAFAERDKNKLRELGQDETVPEDTRAAMMVGAASIAMLVSTLKAHLTQCPDVVDSQALQTEYVYITSYLFAHEAADINMVTDMLNAYGQEGWRFTGHTQPVVNGTFYYFERPATDNRSVPHAKSSRPRRPVVQESGSPTPS